MFNKIIIEGPDGAGKSTLVNHILNKYDWKMIHSSSTTENTYKYHLDLLEEENTVFDRFNLGELIYPYIFNRDAKMNLLAQITLMMSIRDMNIPYIIFYASDFNTLKERLFKRGDNEQVLANAEKINFAFMFFGKMLAKEYANVHLIDISEVKDQVDYFENNIIKNI